jgi:hypothetical protein
MLSVQMYAPFTRSWTLKSNVLNYFKSPFVSQQRSSGELPLQLPGIAAHRFGNEPFK